MNLKKGNIPLAKLPYFQEIMKTYEKGFSMVPESTQDPFIMQLLEEVNKLKAEHHDKILDWNQPRLCPLTMRIICTSQQRKTKQKLDLQSYTGREYPVEHIHVFESTMAYLRHNDEERCLIFPSTLYGGALNWYCRLQPNTVYSFTKLRKLFVAQHIF